MSAELKFWGLAFLCLYSIRSWNRLVGGSWVDDNGNTWTWPARGVDNDQRTDYCVAPIWLWNASSWELQAYLAILRTTLDTIKVSDVVVIRSRVCNPKLFTS